MKQKPIPGRIYRAETKNPTFRNLNGRIYQADEGGILRGLTLLDGGRWSDDGFHPLPVSDFLIWDTESFTWLPVRVPPSFKKGVLYRYIASNTVYVALGSNTLKSMTSGRPWSPSGDLCWEHFQRWNTENMIWETAFRHENLNTATNLR